MADASIEKELNDVQRERRLGDARAAIAELQMFATSVGTVQSTIGVKDVIFFPIALVGAYGIGSGGETGD